MTELESGTVETEVGGGRDVWSLDEYIVVADLYLRRGRSSGVRDPEVGELSQLTGRSPASISRRLGNFAGTVYPGTGLKPVIGEPRIVFDAMRSDDGYRQRVLSEARSRLQAVRAGLGSGSAPRLVDPESLEVEEGDIAPPVTTRRLVRSEAQLVRRYRTWLDPEGTRLRGLIIPIGGGSLRADLVDTLLNILIEAKAEASREHVRYAIGQLFDYQRFMDPRPDLAILVPRPLPSELRALPEVAGVGVIWEAEDGFVDSAGGRLTVRV